MKLSPTWGSSACCWKKVHGFEILLKEMQIKCSDGVIVLRLNRGLFMRWIGFYIEIMMKKTSHLFSNFEISLITSHVRCECQYNYKKLSKDILIRFAWWKDSCKEVFICQHKWTNGIFQSYQFKIDKEIDITSRKPGVSVSRKYLFVNKTIVL